MTSWNEQSGLSHKELGCREREIQALATVDIVDPFLTSQDATASSAYLLKLADSIIDALTCHVC